MIVNFVISTTPISDEPLGEQLDGKMVLFSFYGVDTAYTAYEDLARAIHNIENDNAFGQLSYSTLGVVVALSRGAKSAGLTIGQISMNFMEVLAVDLQNFQVVRFGEAVDNAYNATEILKETPSARWDFRDFVSTIREMP